MTYGVKTFRSGCTIPLPLIADQTSQSVSHSISLQLHSTNRTAASLQPDYYIQCD